MKELIQQLESTDDAEYLLDTCFLIYEISKGRKKELEDFCGRHKVAMCSFNLHELEHVTKKIPGTTVHHIRDFLKDKKIKMYKIWVMPGMRDDERRYVQAYDPDLLRIIADPSDAVMAVAALKAGATILTRDRHHIFTAIAENRGLKVENTFPDKP